MNSAPDTDAKRPAVLVEMGAEAADEVLEPILWGLEEEGIPAAVHRQGEGPATLLAKKAADASPLNVGIGIDGNSVALHHRDLAATEPLFLLAGEQLRQGPLRCLGVNAARLVKGDPLVMDEGEGREGQAGSRDEIEKLVTAIVYALINKDGSWKSAVSGS